MIDVQSNIDDEHVMMTSECAESEAVRPLCKKVALAVKELKIRLEAQHKSRFPGQEFRLRKAIEEAEAAAWGTSFPHLFLPDLAEEAIEQLEGSLSLEFKDETVSFASMAGALQASGVGESKRM